MLSTPTQTILSTEKSIDVRFWDYFNMEVPQPMNASEIADGPMNVSASVLIANPQPGFIVGVYSVLLVIGALGNVAVFTSLVRSRRRKSRVNLLMTHLASADLIVTAFCIPLEIGWRTTNQWLAGNFACKFFQVIRAFGLYLSSNVLVCISLDRFFAVLYPLRLAIARKRSKTMLACSWIVALLCSAPQSLVFRVMSHPQLPEFQQCVAFDAFSNRHQETAYNVLCLVAMYFLPLLIITVCYGCIFYEISKNSTVVSDKCGDSERSRIKLRRSDERPLARARRRTLRMTVTIVSVFACCWLPYATMTLWYMLDRSSAEHVSSRLQDLFFMMAVSNSCMDPLVYGSYALSLDMKNVLASTFRKILCLTTASPDIQAVSTPGTLKSKATAVLQPECIGVPKRAQRFTVRFEETSFVAPSAGSDPSPWSENKDGACTLKPSRSCEVFTLHSTPRRLRASLDSSETEPIRFARPS